MLHAPPPHGYAAASFLGAGDGGRATAAGNDPVAVSARNNVIDRMVLLNYNHAILAWQGRRSQPICPHSIAFLYADPTPVADAAPNGDTPQWHRVAAATRIVHDTLDVRHLPDLLFRLNRLARTRYLPTPGGFDPAVHMAVYRDDASGHANYIGIGVSTLDTRQAPWEQAYRAAEDVDDLSGRALALLFDHTAILVDRGSPRQTRGDLGVHSTGELNYFGEAAPRIWTRHPEVSSMPVDREVWDLMHELHQLVYHQDPRPTL
ncbi:MAG: hypothetical protein QOE61_5 [Micromonosporaceae bacterium]|nr:hypothetical protein [Micromonosporaceae bacterium]